MKNLSWANFALGLWLIMAPFALLYRGMQNALWEDVIVGFLIAVFSLWQAISTETEQAKAANWIVGVLGLLALISPYVLQFSGTVTALRNNVAVGAAVTILAIWLSADLERHQHSLHSLRTHTKQQLADEGPGPDPSCQRLVRVSGIIFPPLLSLKL